MGLHPCVCWIWSYNYLYDGTLSYAYENQGSATYWEDQFAAFFLAFKGIEAIRVDSGGQVSLGSFFNNKIFRNIVLSLVATLGLYIFASLLFVSCTVSKLPPRGLTSYQFEPWHMITSFLQYLLMAPSYIAVLNVYAVCPLALVSTMSTYLTLYLQFANVQ